MHLTQKMVLNANWGVPQGSILGPLTLVKNIFSSSSGSIIMFCSNNFKCETLITIIRN